MIARKDRNDTFFRIQNKKLANKTLTGRVSHIASSLMLSSSPGIRVLHILEKDFFVVLKMPKAKSAKFNYIVKVLINEFLY